MGEEPEILLVMRRAGLLLSAMLLLPLAACKKVEPEGQASARVDAADYDAFWLWAGVKPQGVLKGATRVYILDSEYRAATERRLAVLRPDIPRVQDTDIWLVMRAETLDWPEDIYQQLFARMARWDAESRLAGLQIDFDAQTPALDGYADFLRDLRRRLPPQYKLSITGLLDWSANGDPAHLGALSGIVDEVVLQTYQGRDTIPGYADYFRNISALGIPFRIGLVQGGEWRAPPGLEQHEGFKAYVIFLLNPPTTGSSGIQR